MTGIISILLPARGRPESFARAVRPLFRLASDPDRVEVLARVDDDDPTDYESKPSEFGRYLVVRGPRLGYRRVFEHFNELAALSRGDWLLNWNDDAEMLTSGWDALMRQATPHSIQFLRRDILQHADTTFPLTGRSVYEAMGHIALQTHADDWLRVVAERSGTAIWRDDIVFHHYRLSDESSRERDATGYDVPGFHAPEMQARMTEDAQRVRAAAPRDSP
jgi:hypothetical protein